MSKPEVIKYGVVMYVDGETEYCMNSGETIQMIRAVEEMFQLIREEDRDKLEIKMNDVVSFHWGELG